MYGISTENGLESFGAYLDILLLDVLLVPRPCLRRRCLRLNSLGGEFVVIRTTGGSSSCYWYQYCMNKRLGNLVVNYLDLFPMDWI